MLRLRTATDPSWIDVVRADFDAFLIENRQCHHECFGHRNAISYY